jgi:hypothetical protein
MVALLSLLGCAAAPAGWLDPAADDDWSDAIATTEHRAEWDTEQVAKAFRTSLSHGFPVPQAVLTDYIELMTHADASCPNGHFSEGFLEMGGCTSNEGYTYRGAAGLVRTGTAVYGEDGSWTGDYGLGFAPADYVILRPDGTGLEAGGNVNVQIIQDAHQSNWNARITGTFIDAGAGGWLAGGFSGDLLVSGHAGLQVEMTIDGPMSVDGAAVVFSSLTLSLDDCPDGAISGTVRIRQPDGTWYEVVLGEGCGSCGPGRWNDVEDIGEVCLDLEPILDAVATLSAP